MMRYRWLIVRCMFAAFWLWGGLHMRQSDAMVVLWQLAFVFVASACQVRFWVGREYRKLPAHQPWLRPSWFVNPFLTKQPMQFFHLIGVSLLVAGVAMIFNSGWHISGMSSFVLAFGAGTYLGVWWFVLANRQRFLLLDANGT